MVEPVIKSSFIPDSAETAPVRRMSGGGVGDLIALIALIAFVASAALAAGVFLYTQYLNSSSASKSAQLARAQEAFEPALIRTLTRLDDRMHAADQILGSHTAPSVFFDILEDVTLKTVSFRSLALNAADSARITIKMKGIAESVNSIALQADLFTKNGAVTSPIFSDIDRQADGVHFDVSALLAPSAIRYVNPATSAVPPSALEEQSQGASSQEQGVTDPFGQHNKEP